MFPSKFDYVAAGSVDEAIAAKASGDDVRFLAGGQSLIPMMKTRLATPAKLVDINRIPGLDTLERTNGHLRVGALVRHADIVRSDLTFGAIASAAPWISDPLVRNRGTLCGSVAHCDPEGDWNSVLLATGADVVARGPSGERVDPDRRLRRRLLHQRARRRRDGDRGPHPGAVRAGRAARTRSSSARSATTRRSRSPPTSSSPPTARSRAPASRSPRSTPVNTKVPTAEQLLDREAAERRAVRRGGRARRRRRRHHTTTCAAPPSGSATSCGCSPVGRWRAAASRARARDRARGARSIVEITVTVNGTDHTHDVEPRMLLVDFMRDERRRSPAPTSAATPRAAARARCCSTARR